MGDEKHVHFVSGTTTEVDEHVHTFVFATLIFIRQWGPEKKPGSPKTSGI